MVYDIQGREVTRLAQGRYPAGRHVVTWNTRARHAPADGMYFVRMEVPGRRAIMRRIVVAD